MALFYGDKRPATSCRNLALCNQLSVNNSAVSGRFDDACAKLQVRIRGRRSQQFHVKIRSYCARWRSQTIAFHQMIGCSPIRVAIKDGADNSAIKDARKRHMMRFCVPGSYDLITLWKTANVKTFFICRPTSEADSSGRILLLQGFLAHTRKGLHARRQFSSKGDGFLRGQSFG